jgi:VanZ family protein
VTRALSRWLPVVIYMAAIFYVQGLSTIPGPAEQVPDWLLHSACYGGLALVSLRAVAGGRWANVTIGTLIAAGLISVIYGATDEWHQMYVPGRTSEFRDWVNDALGAAAAMGLAWAWSTMRRSSRNAHDL